MVVDRAVRMIPAACAARGVEDPPVHRVWDVSMKRKRRPSNQTVLRTAFSGIGATGFEPATS
jgi:hypothetical protein